jgi:hypothetical protein
VARLYADENFPYPVVVAVRRAGRDVLTAAGARKSGQSIPDEEVLAFAHAPGRAVLTHNRKDFRRLHQAAIPHSGMILCTEDSDFDALAARIEGAMPRSGGLEGQMILVRRPPG